MPRFEVRRFAARAARTFTSAATSPPGAHTSRRAFLDPGDRWAGVGCCIAPEGGGARRVCRSSDRYPRPTERAPRGPPRRGRRGGGRLGGKFLGFWRRSGFTAMEHSLCAIRTEWNVAEGIRPPLQTLQTQRRAAGRAAVPSARDLLRRSHANDVPRTRDPETGSEERVRQVRLADREGEGREARRHGRDQCHQRRLQEADAAKFVQD